MPSPKVLPGRPPRQALDTFREALNLPKDVLEKANVWLKRNSGLLQQLDMSAALAKAAEETRLDRGDLVAIVTLVANVGLFVEDDEKFAAVLEDLKALGLSDAQVVNFEVLMNGIRFPQGRVTVTTLQSLMVGLPRVVDFNAVCDLRAVFEVPPDHDTDEAKTTHLMALVPTVILTVDVRQESGRLDSVVMQFAEDEFSKFQANLDRVAKQLKRVAEIGKDASAKIGEASTKK